MIIEIYLQINNCKQEKIVAYRNTVKQRKVHHHSIKMRMVGYVFFNDVVWNLKERKKFVVFLMEVFVRLVKFRGAEMCKI